LAIAPDSRGQKPDHVSITAAGRTRNARGLKWPISHGPGREQPQWTALEPLATFEIACAVAGSMTLAADGHVLDNVPATIYQGTVGIVLEVIVRLLSSLRPALVSENRNYKKCNENHQ